ncbi:MAG: DEAD/DEAH box helicase [Thermoplasmatota archaeon]
MSAFDLLSPPLRSLLAAEGFTEPTRAQEAAIPVILCGAHTLLIAPTGMGKTESAVLPLFDRLLAERGSAEADKNKIRLVYVTPLRALNRDLMGRLHAWGLTLGIDVRVRHGDTTPSERNRQSHHPPDVLITTPETLQAMFLGKRLRAALAGVKHVVVDEVHELASDERGAQLAVALERLVEVAGEFQRVGLSATVGDAKEVADFLGGVERAVEVVKVPVAKALKLRVIAPSPSARDVATADKLMCKPEAAASLNACLDAIGEAKQTLLFVNTRETAEVLTARVRILDESFPLAIHHGSLSRDVRIAAEESFKSGASRALVCTSSMELGIDIGAADLVIQYSSPRQVTRLVQRVGRAGHRHDLVSNGIVLAQDPDDIAESYVIASRTKREELETFRSPRNPLDVLANQLEGMTLEGRNEMYPVYEIVRRAHPFRDLSFDDFEETLWQMQETALLWNEAKRFGAKHRARLHFVENLSMIPDERTWRVVNMVTRRPVATLDAAFVAAFVEPEASFICQGVPWRVITIEPERAEIHVEPVKDPLGAVPSWLGEEIPVPFEVAEEVGQLRARIAQLAREHGPDDAAKELAAHDGILAPEAATKLVAYVEEQGAYALPTDRVVTLDFGAARSAGREGAAASASGASGYGGGVCIINACLGTKANETLGRLLSALLSARLGESVGLQIDPYRIILTLPGKIVRTDVRGQLLEIDPDTLKPLLERLLTSSVYVKMRMLHVARKFGAVAKDADLTRVNVTRLLETYRGTPLYREAMREVFDDKLDVVLAARFLRKIRSGEIELVVQGLSPIGAAGLDTRVELISPARADRTLLAALEKRLASQKVLLGCVANRDWHAETTVTRAAKMRVCPKCGATLIAIARPWNDVARRVLTRSKRAKMNDEERAELARLTTSANLYLDHGERALLALVARGVGPDTAGRLIAKQKESKDGFLRAVLEAEITYARTRQFWD